MAEAKHTPGPWERGSHRTVIARCGNSSIAICDVYSGGCDSLAEADANEAVLSAAPELLASTRRLAFLLASACFVINDAEARQTALEAIRDAKAAISKATGAPA